MDPGKARSVAPARHRRDDMITGIIKAKSDADDYNPRPMPKLAREKVSTSATFSEREASVEDRLLGYIRLVNDDIVKKVFADCGADDIEHNMTLLAMASDMGADPKVEGFCGEKTHPVKPAMKEEEEGEEGEDDDETSTASDSGSVQDNNNKSAEDDEIMDAASAALDLKI